MKSSSSNGCTRRPVMRSDWCVSTARQHSSNDALTMVAPSRSMAASLVAGAPSMTRTDAGAPASRAASATPCAALPALTVQTPSASSAGVSWATAFIAPRILNDPIGWKTSSLRKISGRRPRPIGSRRTSGVRAATAIDAGDGGANGVDGDRSRIGAAVTIVSDRTGEQRGQTRPIQAACYAVNSAAPRWRCRHVTQNQPA